MIIDSHQHVFWHGKDDAGLIADMDVLGIALAWLLTWEIPRHPHYPDNTEYHYLLNPARLRDDGTHPGIPLEDLLLARSRYPDRFVLGYCPDPAQERAVQLFESACDIHGVQICGEWKFRLPFDDPRCLELFKAAARRRAPVVLHLDVPYLRDPTTNHLTYQPKWYGGTVANLERALQACPDTVFIGHAPGFWREISGDAETDPAVYPTGPVTPNGRLFDLFERYPNLHADLSAGSALGALKRDPRLSTDFLTRHADRILFGRDYYGDALLTFLQTLPLSDDARRRIYFENAQRLLAP
jgi:predicted TIM-barrel fold metal-dependent hydrolase